MNKIEFDFKKKVIAAMVLAAAAALTYSPPLQISHQASEKVNEVNSKNQNEPKRTLKQTFTQSESEVFKYKMNGDIENQLRHFHQINKKVFLSKNELEFKSKILSDQKVMIEMKNILLRPSNNIVETELLQSFALEYLYEAVSSGHQLAQDMLVEIIKDSSIENRSVPLSDRQAMAEIKADVMFNFSAMTADSEELIEKRLPGPISQKIWANVKLRQQRYLAESQIELSEEFAETTGFLDE